MDNFKWVEGFCAHLGLTKVDFATQQRRLGPGGHFFGEICRQHGLTGKMIERHGTA